MFTKDAWNYGLLEAAIKSPSSNFVASQKCKPNENFIWNLANSPIEITAKAKKIPDWKIVNDVAPNPVTARDGVYKGKVDDRIETGQNRCFSRGEIIKFHFSLFTFSFSLCFFRGLPFEWGTLHS